MFSINAARRLPLVVAVALALVASAGARAAAEEPQSAFNAADQALAESHRVPVDAMRLIVKAQSVLEQRTVSLKATRSAGLALAFCADGAPDLSDLTATGSADSPDFRTNGGLKSLVSRTVVFATDAQAKAAFHRLSGSVIRRCLGTADDQLRASGIPITHFASDRLPTKLSGTDVVVAAARFAASAHFVGTIQVTYLCKHRVLEMVAATIIGDSVDVVLPTEVLVNDLVSALAGQI